MQKHRMYKVYWIHAEDMEDIRSQGYVGITKNNLHYRFGQHTHSKRPVGHILRELISEGVVLKIVEVYRGTREQAMKKEYELRPKRFIGWNIRAGGNRATIVCVKCGVTIPKGYTNNKKLCSTCHDNDGRFLKGREPWNKGRGEKYMLISPEGIEYIPDVFTTFCKEYDLTPQNIRKVAKGTRKHHKGWTATKLV